MTGSVPPAATGPGCVHVLFGYPIHVQPDPDAVIEPERSPLEPHDIVIRPLLGVFPRFNKVTWKFAVPPDGNGPTLSTTNGTRSTCAPCATGVLALAELLRASV